ncbi:hypothetical protein KR044_000217, partial [Drosophila immigrans]
QQQQQQQQPRVVFMTRAPEERPDPGQILVVVIDETTLQLFIRKVYFIAVIFVLATSVTWLGISGTECHVYAAIPVPFLVWLLPVLVIMLLMDCIPKIRYTFPWNWMLTIIIVILVTIAGAYVMGSVKVLVLLLGLAIAAGIVAVFYVYGAMCPLSLLLGFVATSVLSCLLTITALVIAIVLLFVDNLILFLVFGILLLCMTVVVMPLHAQFIHGRLQIVPLLDSLHCARGIYFHFIVIFTAIAIINFYDDAENK